MKALKELKGNFGSKDIGELVDFVSKAPIELPENKQYHFEKNGNVVEIYCIGSGIRAYAIGKLEQGVQFNGASSTSKGTELNLVLGGVEKVVLHAKPYVVQPTNPVRNSSEAGASSSGESRASGESRNSSDGKGSGYLKTGESRDGESRS